MGCWRWKRENWNSPWWPSPPQKGYDFGVIWWTSGGGSRGQLSLDSIILVSQELSQRCLRRDSGASHSSDGSWSSWHRECGFQEKPWRAGASGVGMSLKLKPLGICALRRRPEATGLSKVNVIPGMGTACPSGPGASLAWLTETEPLPSSKASMIFTVTRENEHWIWNQEPLANVMWTSHFNSLSLGLPCLPCEVVIQFNAAPPSMCYLSQSGYRDPVR